MHRLRRRETRRRYHRPAKIKLAAGARACDCLVVAMSDGGVRLNVEGLDVPDEFVLLISNDRKVQERAYKVVWRFGNEPGAKFVGGARQVTFAERDFVKRDPVRMGH
jgi:PilZ domain